MRGILLDHSLKMRANLSLSFSTEGIVLEPCETMDEWVSLAPRFDFGLVADVGDKLRLAVKSARSRRIFLPVLAYGDGVTSNVVNAMKCGAQDYFSYPIDISRAKHRIRAAIVGSKPLSDISERTKDAFNRQRNLTFRERQVLAGMTAGGSNKHIARDLCLSPRTVEIHRANMMGRLGVEHSAEAIRIAVEAELHSQLKSGSERLI